MSRLFFTDKVKVGNISMEGQGEISLRKVKGQDRNVTFLAGGGEGSGNISPNPLFTKYQMMIVFNIRKVKVSIWLFFMGQGQDIFI